MSKIQQLRNKLEQEKGRKIQTEQLISSTTIEVKEQNRSLRHHEQAREVIKQVGLKTQQQLQFHISDIASLALEAIFDNPYELIVEFVQRRNKTECDLYFSRNDNRVDPIDASGIGAVDIAAFALRVASWSMQTPHTRNSLILDEPFKHLKGEKANLRVLDLTKEISQRLGLQIIMISDERVDRDDIEEKTDKVFETKIRKGVSQIT